MVVDIAAHRHRFNGVDGGYAVGPCEMRSQRNLCHGADIGCHLGDDGDVDGPLDEGGVVSDKFRILAHVAAHAGIAHLRAREIQFHRIESGRLGHLRQFDPLFLVLPHDGGDDDLLREILLKARENVEILLDGILRQLLHVAEAGETAVGPFYGVKARRDLVDVLQADGLVIDARPTGPQGRRHHLVVGADGGGSQEERILAAQPAESGFQRGEPFLRNRFRQGVRQIAQADGPVIMDTGFFGGQEVFFAAGGKPAAGDGLVHKKDGPDGTGGIAGLA